MTRALILVGGFGTRLRPLTLSCPKPLVEFAGKPMIVHQIEACKEVGVTEVVLAINYQPELMLSFVEEYQKKLGIKITISKEDEPMGTAGPLAIARSHLQDGKGSPFFVFNSDVTCEYPLKEMLAFHNKTKAEATLLVTKVEDPTKYGVVVFDEKTGAVERFVEKPQVFVGDKINAGIYVLSPSVLDRIPMKPTSIEKEVFPLIAAEKKLSAMILPGFWMDIGQPKDFLIGLGLYLKSLRKRKAEMLTDGVEYVGNVLVDPSASVSPGCKIGPDVSIGANCIIEEGVRLEKCSIFSGCTVRKHACITNSLVGWKSQIGAWARVDGSSVLGEDVQVKGELVLNGAIVLPHKEVKESIFTGKIVL
eukprot:CAMPEP_0170143354 /NCGR_PEP_ID=MMETSP0033_2-20121228/10465_1 /TAXON_ID=195969 /ORGANISM="Dolichomastix tenuilepis, Strain CCMP3274" /LENGTH=362 /DNA_ID=CAMNT_0010379801 /DNA_START=16 /DNA_END=1104 /DNA_ORIENTATION=+